MLLDHHGVDVPEKYGQMGVPVEREFPSLFNEEDGEVQMLLDHHGVDVPEKYGQMGVPVPEWDQHCHPVFSNAILGLPAATHFDVIIVKYLVVDGFQRNFSQVDVYPAVHFRKLLWTDFVLRVGGGKVFRKVKLWVVNIIHHI